MNIFGIAYVVIGIFIGVWSYYGGAKEMMEETVYNLGDDDTDDGIVQTIVILMFAAAIVAWPFAVAIAILYEVNDKRHTNNKES